MKGFGAVKGPRSSDGATNPNDHRREAAALVVLRPAVLRMLAA
jgi:hypothetical protein